MRITSAGNVGIGATAPLRKLHVVGNFAVNAATDQYYGVNISGGEGSDPKITIGDWHNSGSTLQWDSSARSLNLDTQYSTSAGTFNITCNDGASTFLTILPSGNVGIGTTSPGAKLEIAGFSTGQGLKMNYGNSSGTIEAVNFIANGGANGVIGMQMVSAGVGDLWLGGSNGRSLTLYRDGNVGIGTSTPNAKLDVQGTQGQLFSVTDDLSGDIFSVADISGVPIMNVNSSGVSYFDGSLGIGTDSPKTKLNIVGGDVQLDSGQMLSFYTGASTGVQNNGIKGSDVDDSLRFYTGALERITIKGANVGIGTDSPIVKLHTRVSSSTTALMLENSTGGLGAYVDLDFNTYNTAQAGFSNAAASIRVIDNGAFGGDITFRGKTAGIGNAQSELMRIKATGNVGIGTTSPSRKLDVVGVIQAQGNFYSTVSSSSTNLATANGGQLSLYNSNSTDNNFNNIGGYNSNSLVTSQICFVNESHANRTGAIAFLTHNGSSMPERMRITSAGNVGIGTTSPGYTLEIAGPSATSFAYQRTGVSANKWGFHSDNDATYWQNLTSSNLLFTLQNGGNVGIGTTSPGAKLDVFGNLQLGDGTNNFNTNIRGVFGVSYAWNINSLASGLQIISTASGATGITIQAGGNVGIGNDDPGAKLDVKGSYGDVIKAVSGSQNITTNFVAPSGSSGLNNIISTAGRFNIGTSDDQPFSLLTNSISRIAILSDGKVGIGVTNPSYKLEVSGTLGVNRTDGIIFAGSAAAGYGNKITADTSNDFIFSTSLPSAPYTVSEKMRIANGGATTFTSTVTATNFILSSDERLKENVEKVCDNRVKADWKTFELKTEKGQKRYGVIAQELEKTNPEFVREDSQGFKSVAYIDLLIAKIAELEARLEKLEK